MNLKLVLLSVMLGFGVTVWGQAPVTTPEDAAKKKEINTLKKEGEAYYSDVYHEMKVENEAELAEAQQRSKDMLKAHVVEIFYKRMGMTKEDVREIWKVLEKNCQHIVVKRGDLFRVFTYVMKNALNPDATFVPAEGEVASVQPDSIQELSSLSDVKADTVVTSSVTLEPEPVIQPEIKVDTVAVVPSVPEPEQKPEPMPEPEPTPEIIVPELCQKLIAKGNFDQVYRFLQQEKAYQRLMYGTARTMQRPEKCYIVLTDKTSGAIVGVLDKGESERMNFVTKKMDHFRNYQGGNYKAIFVQEY